MIFPACSIVLFYVVQIAGKDYKRLTAQQPVGLRHAGLVISLDKLVKVCSDSIWAFEEIIM